MSNQNNNNSSNNNNKNVTPNTNKNITKPQSPLPPINNFRNVNKNLNNINKNRHNVYSNDLADSENSNLNLANSNLDKNINNNREDANYNIYRNDNETSNEKSSQLNGNQSNQKTTPSLQPNANRNSRNNNQNNQKANGNGFKNNRLNNFLNNKNIQKNVAKVNPALNVVNKVRNSVNKNVEEEGEQQENQLATMARAKVKQKIFAMIMKILPIILPYVGLFLLIILIVIIVLSVVLAVLSDEKVAIPTIDVNYCTSVNISWGDGSEESTIISDDEYIADLIYNSTANGIDNSDVIKSLAIIYRTNLYADTDNIETHVCKVKVKTKYETTVDNPYLNDVKNTLKKVYTFDRTKLSVLPINDYFSWREIKNNGAGKPCYYLYVDNYLYPTEWVDGNVPKDLMNQDSSMNYGFNAYGALYLAENKNENYHDLLYHFYSYNQETGALASEQGNIYKIDPEDNTSNDKSDFDNTCSSISLTSTNFSRDEFLSIMSKAGDKDSDNKDFYNHAATIYDVSVANNFNPEMVVIRAKAEGFSPGASKNNYWGIGCSNGTDNCKSYGSFDEGLLAFIKNVSKYSTAQSMMSKYAYIGKYWYNGDYTSSKLGGCYYYSSIKDYLTAERSKTVQDACYNSPNMCSESGGSGCLPTNNEDQNAYATWQVAHMASIGSGIFGTIESDCSGDTDGTSSSGSSKKCTIYAQGDSKWASKKLGSSNATMSSAGCAVTSIAIGISCSGTDITLSNFNAGTFLDKLNSAGCIDSSGNISWSCSGISSVAPSVHFISSISLKGMSSSDKINKVKSNSTSNTFVILHISNAQHSTHFVVYQKTSGNSFVVKDPAGGKIGNYSVNDIDSIRVYGF